MIDRFYIFKENLKFIEETNKGNNTFQLGVTPFADMTNDEYRDLLFTTEKSMTGYGLGLSLPKNYCKDKSHSEKNSFPSSVDWRLQNAVTPVKDQGQCGSCWSFSSTGALEAAYSIKFGELVSFSEQQLVDCSTSYGNHGCNGGLMQYAFSYVLDNGISGELNYPYTSGDGSTTKTCLSYDSVTKIKSCYNVPANELQLTLAVSIQPVSVSIEADTKSFQLYKSGVYTDAKCGTKLDHGVLVVGYGNLNGQDYWIVKNSWSEKWGDKGYIYIARNSVSSSTEGLCGIAMDASYPEI